MKDVQYIYLSWRFFKVRKRSNSEWQKLAHDLRTDSLNVSFSYGYVATDFLGLTEPVMLKSRDQLKEQINAGKLWAFWAKEPRPGFGVFLFWQNIF